MLIIALLYYYVCIVSRFSLKNIYMYYQEISCSKMLHFPFRIQLENQGSSLNPTQNTGATQLSGMSGEIGDGRHELETTRQPRRTDCAYTMLSQCTMVSPTSYAEDRFTTCTTMQKKEKLLFALLDDKSSIIKFL